MRTRIIDVAEMDASDISRWGDLVEQSLNPYPFIDPRLVVPATRHLALAQGMRVVVVEDASEFLALMTFAPFRLMTGMPPRGISTENAFLDQESTWNHPLIHAERAQEGFDALLLGLRALRFPRLLDFRTLPAGGALESTIHESANRLRVSLFERERREFAYAGGVGDHDNAHAHGRAIPSKAETSFELAHASSHLRRNISRTRRALEAELGSELRLEDRHGDPAALDQFIELQAAGWKGDQARGGAGLRAEGYEKWIVEVASRYRRDGDLIIYALSAGAQCIHMNVMFRIGDTIFGYADTYDERFARFGPGVLGRVAAINRALTEPGVQFFEPNLSPYYASDSRLYSGRHTRVRLLAANGGFIANGVVRVMPFAKSLRRRIARK